MPNRKKAQDFILTYIDKILPGGLNRQQYEALFKEMSDQEFDVFMKQLESGERFLVGIVPNNGPTKVTVENNLAVAKELGHQFFQKLWIGPKKGIPAYLTPIPYLVMNTVVRRQSQHMRKKQSIPQNDKSIDQLTGQPTGASKGAQVSYPELQVLLGMDLDNTTVELIKYRGGDKGGYNALNAMISRYGSANIKTLQNYATGVQSTKMLKTFLTAAHLKNTL